MPTYICTTKWPNEEKPKVIELWCSKVKTEKDSIVLLNSYGNVIAIFPTQYTTIIEKFKL